MLNLSDKDLDRLSQDAAQQYEPEDIGPKLWDKLEARLDRDLGKVNLNPARGIRRLPYYYAPVLLVILGAGYYFARTGGRSSKGMSSASPPVSILPPPSAGGSNATHSSTNSVQSDRTNATHPLSSTTVPYPVASGGKDAAAAPPLTAHPAPATASHTTPARGDKSELPASAANAFPASPSSHPRAAGSTAARSTGIAPGAPAPASVRNYPGSNGYAAAKPLSRDDRSQLKAGSGRNHRSMTRPGGNPAAGLVTAGHPQGSKNKPRSAGTLPAPSTTQYSSTDQISGASRSAGISEQRASGASKVRELTYSSVQGPVEMSGRPVIDDSALRAFDLAAGRQSLDLTANARQNRRKDGLHVNNSLVFGLMGGPDFASVNSVGGARAGSSFGLTVDYEFANHWYIGSGLLYTQKVFAAAPQDYHVPAGYYSQNGMGMGMSSDVRWINGRFEMLEIPLNLRFDFNATGNTLFFASAGASSYLFTSENCGYSYSFYNRIESKQFTYGNHPDNLFSSLNFSVGVEAGISNTVSILVSPYVKIPTRNIGFGQVQLNSFGIDFALRFAPVISRRR